MATILEVYVPPLQEHPAPVVGYFFVDSVFAARRLFLDGPAGACRFLRIGNNRHHRRAECGQ